MKYKQNKSLHLPRRNTWIVIILILIAMLSHIQYKANKIETLRIRKRLA